jgi:GTPase SAR1 family protein
VAVALQNAIPTLKEEADIVTDQPDGLGVESLIEQILASDLAEIPDRRSFSSLPLGTTAAGGELSVNSFTSSFLIAGPSASGKSTLVHSLLETMLGRGYQVCLVDPEGDYEQAEGILSLGAPGRPPDLSEISKALDSSSTSIAVNLLGLSIDERPPFFSALLTRLQEIRAKFGRPHWIIFDEAHHLMPSSWQPNPSYPALLDGVVLVTVHPEAISPLALKSIKGALAVGDAPENTLEKFRAAAGLKVPVSAKESAKESGNVVAWFPYERDPNRRGPFALQVTPPTRELRRHKRKYAVGELGEDKSFYFRGPDGKLNLQAQNLALFIQIAKGVDDATWSYHLKQHDYSRWLSEAIKDDTVSSDVLKIENANLPPEESRKQIFRAIETHYTADDKNTLG